LGVSSFAFAYNSNPADPAVFGHSADEISGLSTGGSGVPSGSIVMFEVDCPTGWDVFSEMNDRFPLGSAPSQVGTNSKSAHSSNTGKTSPIPPGGVRGGNDDDLTPSIGARLDIPYQKVVYCKKQVGTTTPPITPPPVICGAGEIKSDGVCVQELSGPLSGFYGSDSTGCGGSRQGMYATCPGDKLPVSQTNLRMGVSIATQNHLCSLFGFDQAIDSSVGSAGISSDTDRWNYDGTNWRTSDVNLQYLNSVSCKNNP
jgi:hypothetical protein